MNAPAPARCPGCLEAAERVAHSGAPDLCAACGHSWLPDGEVLVPRVRRTRVPSEPKPAPAERRVDVGAFVGALLRWQSKVARVERLAFGDASANTLSVMRALEIGVTGSGNRGTKGVGYAPGPDRDDLDARAVDPIDAARYRALGRLHQGTADAVIDDGQGDHDAEIELDVGVRVTLSLAQRVGWRITAPAQRTKWLAKIVARDARPALNGMTEAGDAALCAAAAAWFAAEKPGV
jgi:hypothetical protein